MTLMAVPIYTVYILMAVSGCTALWTVEKLTAKTDGSVTIPCHYNQRFRQHEKYWCKGKMWYTCILVRDSPGRVKVTDDPFELVTTLTLYNLQIKDSNRYWCAVKMKGVMKNDIRASLELLVNNIPDVWVSSTVVDVPEGGNVSVQCLFSSRLKEAEKTWCRGGDIHSCQSEHTSHPSKNEHLHLQDNRSGLFTVTIVEVKKSDAGWFWCSAERIQAPVHITVSTVLHNSTSSQTEFLESSSPSPSSLYSFTNAVTSTHSTNPPGTSLGELMSSPPVRIDSDFSSPFTSAGAVLIHHQSATPIASYRLTVCLITVITAAVLLLTTAAGCWRWRKHRHCRSRVIEDCAESAELSVNDEDGGLLNSQWSEIAVLQLCDDHNT